MIWTRHTIHFPPTTLLNPAFVAEYLTRYTDPETGWAAAHVDRSEDADADEISDPSKLRKATLFADGEALPTIAPTPVYDPPLSPEEIVQGHAREPVALSITLYWPETFLADLARDPQPEPELFGGVEIQP